MFNLSKFVSSAVTFRPEVKIRINKCASKPVAESEIYVLDIIRNNWKNGQSI